MTQESNILDKDNKEEDNYWYILLDSKNLLDHDGDNKEPDNLFASSLLVDDLSSIAMALARNVLKP